MFSGRVDLLKALNFLIYCCQKRCWSQLTLTQPGSGLGAAPSWTWVTQAWGKYTTVPKAFRPYTNHIPNICIFQTKTICRDKYVTNIVPNEE